MAFVVVGIAVDGVGVVGLAGSSECVHLPNHDILDITVTTY